MAHDLNNLLAPLMAYPELIREDLSADSEALEFLHDIEDAARKIADINQDLLTMGRRGHYEQKPFNLNRVIDQAAKELKSAAKEIAVEQDLSPDLMQIKGGPAQVYRMLSNLLANARDARLNVGQITIRTENYYADDVSVAFGRVPTGEYVKLTISDTGGGIPEDIMPKILEPFFSTKSADRKR